MVAGAAGIQGVLLVVAADEGVMPQTREHLDILTLLGISHGVVALTKKDLVDEEMLDLATEDVQNAVKGTFLENAPLVPLSSHTGEGLPDLLQELGKMVRHAPSRSLQSIFFYPIDRVFPKQGFGTVVTGTAWGGSVYAGDELQALPRGDLFRVRGLQVHNLEVSQAVGGQRIAINLSGAKGDMLERGDVLAPPEILVPSQCCNVMLQVLASSGDRVEHWQRVHVHMGTSESIGRLVFFDRKEATPGDVLPAQLVLETPQSMLRGQRFILRSYSPVRTIAGGEVVLPYGKKPRGSRDRQRQKIFTEELQKSMHSPKKYLLRYLEEMGCLEEKVGLSALQIPPRDFQNLIVNLKKTNDLYVFGEKNALLVSKNFMDQRGKALEEELVQRYAQEKGLRGVPFEKLLAPSFPIKEPRVLRLVAEELVRQREKLLLQEDLFRHVDCTHNLAALYEEKLPLLLDFCRRQGMQFPLVEEVCSELGLSDKDLKGLLGEAKSSGEIALIGENMVLSRFQEESVLAALEGFSGAFTLSEVRDTFESSRKYMLPLLEYLDSRGYTRRVGDKRILRKRSRES